MTKGNSQDPLSSAPDYSAAGSRPPGEGPITVGDLVKQGRGIIAECQSKQITTRPQSDRDARKGRAR